ncbi:MAG: glycoside hydrolase family 130 protein [Bacteroidales bacterium]
MAITVERKNVQFSPDSTKVIARDFSLNSMRATEIVMRVFHMPEKEAESAFNQILRDFSKRHRNITKILTRHFNKVKNIFKDLDIDINDISTKKKLLIGAYFTMEYSIESAAFFNPSVFEDPDQSGLNEGEKRIIVSFRATGEGHISSLVFRRGIIDRKNNLTFQPAGKLIDEAERVKRYTYDKKSFQQKLLEMDVPEQLSGLVLDKLPDKFIYTQIRQTVENIIQSNKMTIEKQKVLKEILWLADSHYELKFSLDTDISERAIFPIMETEKKGIEDARFVRFVDNKGKVDYYATYTAYDGYTIMPKLLHTKDFYHFKVMPLHGKYAQDKNLALFPRKIKGKYVMLSRYDGRNNYIMFSDNINIWEEAKIIQEPKYQWELVQVGNGGSPLETDQGWLMITHGVGPMRKYSLGACLLDLEDPTKVIGRLKEPLLMPNEKEREGYVPNVVYTCGSIIHNNTLFLPYAMADYSSGFATVKIDELLDELMSAKQKQA